MIKNRRNSFANFLFIKFSLIFVFSMVSFSCAFRDPVIISVDNRIVYDYENEKDSPVQKLSVFLKMDYDVRRIENIQLVNNETGFRWIISSPELIQNDNDEYAGYTYLCSSNQDDGLLPEGTYTVYFLDSSGKDAFSTFNLNYDKKNSKLSYPELLKKVEFNRNEITVAVYSADSILEYYGEINYKNSELEDFDFTEYVKMTFQDSAYYRLFYKKDNVIYIMPQVQIEHNVQ